MSTTTTPHETTYREKGTSLARGPALALGVFLVIAGLYFIYQEHGFPRLSQFPNATQHIDGKAFFGIFGLNGWSGELTVAGGGLLMLGAAQHVMAKAASFIVAVVFAGVGIWALVNHHSALGLFAANIWTILLWFAAAAYLLINTLLPRTPGAEHTETREPREAVTTRPVATKRRRSDDADTVIPARDAVRIRPRGEAAISDADTSTDDRDTV